MTTAQTIRLIARRELVDRLRNKVYVLGTLAAAAVVALGIVAVDQFGEKGVQLGAVTEDETLVDAVVETSAAADDAEIDLVEFADRVEATAAVEDGGVAAAVVDRATLVVGEGLPGPGQAPIRRVAAVAMQQASMHGELTERGLSQAEAQRVLRAPEPRVVEPDGEEPEVSTGVLLGYVTTGLLFGAILLNGSLLLTSANQEKSSRVVEVLLAKMRPWQLLAGKLLPLTGLALAQLALVLGAALAANAVVGLVDLPAAAPPAVALALVMLVAGFALFAALFTVAGSLAVSVEHAQTAAMPLQFGVVVPALLVHMSVLPSPEGLMAQVLSFLPPTAPFAIPARVALGVMPGWQVAVAVALTVIGAALTVRLAGRLYAAALLAGDKLTWRDTLRAEPIR